MGFVLLLLLLFVIGLFQFKISKYNIFNLAFISIMCFVIGTILIYSYLIINNIKYDLGVSSIVFYILAFVIIVSSDYVGRMIVSKMHGNALGKNKYFALELIEISSRRQLALLGIAIIMLLSICYNYISIALAHGYTDSIINIPALALYLKNLSITTSYLRLFHLNTYFNYLLRSFCLLSFFIIINNNIFLKKSYKYSSVYIIIILLYLFAIYITGWRKEFLITFASAIILFGIVFNTQRVTINHARFIKIVLYLACIFLLLILFFMFTIYIRSGDKNNTFKYLLDSVAAYSGGAIVCFDEFINGSLKFSNDYTHSFGVNTFYQIYEYLNRLKITNVSIPNPLNLGMLDNVLGINIYTAFFRSYRDFGFLGCIIYFFFLGLLYSTIYNVILNKTVYKYYIVLMIILSYFSSPWFLFTVTDEFSNLLFSTKIIYVTLATILAYELFFRKIRVGKYK